MSSDGRWEHAGEGMARRRVSGGWMYVVARTVSRPDPCVQSGWIRVGGGGVWTFEIAPDSMRFVPDTEDIERLRRERDEARMAAEFMRHVWRVDHCGPDATDDDMAATRRAAPMPWDAEWHECEEGWRRAVGYGGLPLEPDGEGAP